MTLEALRALRNSDTAEPILLTLNDGRQLRMENSRYLGVTPAGVVLAVSTTGTLFLAPEQIKEARALAIAGR
jgi:hypothetical protein